MSDLQKELETAIIETLKDENGAGSDLHVVEYLADVWLTVEGNLDVQHLASHVIETLGLDDYEYAVLRTITGGLDKPRIVGQDWSTLAEINKGLLDLSNDRVNYRIVKRRKAGKVEEVWTRTG